MKFDAELVARDIRLSASDSLQLDESLVLRALGDLTVGVRVERGGQSIADDVSPDGAVRYSITGKSPQGREGERETCEILIERLNRNRGEAEKWGDLTEQPEGSPADYEASTAATQAKRRKPLRLNIQVTRVGDEDFWRRLNGAGYDEGKPTLDDLKEALYAAILAKDQKAGRDIVLAVDARNTPRHAFLPVVDSFREKHGVWAAGVGFQEVWVVGPIADMAERLDLV